MIPQKRYKLRMGRVFYFLSGLPIKEDSSNTSIKYTVFILLCFINRIFAASRTMISNYDQVFGDTDILIKYFVFAYVHFLFQDSISFLRILFNRSKLGEHCTMLEGIQRQTKKIGKKSEKCLQAVRMLMVLSTTMELLIDYFAEVDGLWRSVQNFRLRLPLFIFGLVLLLCYCAFFCALFYNLTSIFIKEMELIENLSNLISNKPKVQGLNSVLPVVEGNSSHTFCDVAADFRCPSTHRCSPWYCGLRQLRNIMRTYCAVNNLHLSVSEVYFLPVTLTTFADSFGFSAMMISFYYSEEVIRGVSLYRPNSLLHIFWIFNSIAPFIFNEWTNYRQEALTVKTAREVFSTVDPQSRRILSDIVSCSKDKYPNSPWKVFGLDYSFLYEYLDVALFLCTTFVVPQS
ncbi:hypothetical protein J6590_028733 [Homalodisca vitripennis]|nr:hypothetical protein J6590_028733 [Homalodisca vitripennis]